jgi:hypothetical protein
MGTRARRAMGGIMERVDKRQGYFLGKIVKGVGKAIGSVADAAGKVLKSDVGKMAIAGLGRDALTIKDLMPLSPLRSRSTNNTFRGIL